MTYTIAHKDALPESLDALWPNPRPLGDCLIYRGRCDDTPCAYEASHELDADGNELVSDAEVVADVMLVMSVPAHGPIVLCKEHTLAVIAAVAPADEMV